MQVGVDLRDATPATVLAAARAALRSVGSYHVHGMLDHGFNVDIVVARNGFEGRVTSHGVTWRAVAVDGRLYFRGATMWRRTISSTTAAGFGDRWVRVRQLGAGFGWAGQLVDLSRTIPSEVFRTKPGLRNTGVRTVRGIRVVHLADRSDVYDVRLAAPHVPITWFEPDEIGVDGAPCGITLDHFGSAVALHEPRTTATY